MKAHSAKRKKVAIFDIDGTIFRSSLLVELVEALIAEGIMPKSASKEYVRLRTKWFNREGEYDDYLMAVVHSFLKHIKGVSRKDFLRVADRVVEVTGRRVYRFTRDLIKELHRQGYFLLAISNSPKLILDKFCKNWGFDDVYGRIYELDNRDRFTGGIEHLELISDKAKILALAIHRDNLTLNGSVGVGDSESDVSFLQFVDNPVCFNPNSKLREVAKKRGWKVVIERKDVVYEL